MTSAEDDRPLFALLEYFKRTRNFDFGNYKRTRLERRLNRSMQVVGINNDADFQDYLEVHPEEFSPLFNSIPSSLCGTRSFRSKSSRRLGGWWHRLPTK